MHFFFTLANLHRNVYRAFVSTLENLCVTTALVP